jgi:5-hydroxyisourate hydrolase-like protein (transthyretin family)
LAAYCIGENLFEILSFVYELNFMKIRFFRYFFGLALIAASLSCNKNNNTPSSADLQFSILDDIGSPASNATVYLYRTEYDYANNVNLVASQVSDNNGTALFTNLSPIAYYYYIDRTNDCATNYFTTNHTSNALTAGITNNISVLINETGQVNFNNYSADPYYVYFNGNLWGTVNGKVTETAVVKPGVYNIHIKQASGFASTPIEEDFKATISTCGTGNVNFP